MEMFASILVNAIFVRGMDVVCTPGWTGSHGKCRQIVSCTCCVQWMAEMLRHRDGQEAKSHYCRRGGSGEMKHKPAFTRKMYVFKGWEIACVLFLSIYKELTLNSPVNRPFPVKCLSLLFQLLVLHGPRLTFWSVQVDVLFSKSNILLSL